MRAMQKLLLPIALTVHLGNAAGSLSFPRGSGLSQRAQRLHAGQEELAQGLRLEGNLSFKQEARKPVRIARGGDSTKESRQDLAPNLDREPRVACFKTVRVTSRSDKWEPCPEDCPYYAQDRNDRDHCTFACVTAEKCNDYHWRTPIPDDQLGVCRGCVVDGCEVCNFNVTYDRCAKCQAGYVLRSDGLCSFKYGGLWVKIVLAVVVIFLILLAIWLVDILLRPTSNKAGLEHALQFREDCKLRQALDDSGERPLWPITTNLMGTLVAGPGMMLHFNFQLALIIWAVWIAVLWMGFCTFVDKNLWVMGTHEFGTPRMNCILVFEGYETHMRLMWVKIRFLWIAYISSFLMCMAYSVLQLRVFQQTDYAHKTFKDFVAVVVGLPSIEGTKPVEEDLKGVIQRLTGQQVVGVSVAWDYREYDQVILKALDQDLRHAEARKESPRRDMAVSPDLNAVQQKLYSLERTLFSLGDASAKEGPDTETIQLTLDNMNTSSRAFVVFETDTARDEAVRRVEAQGGFSFEGAKEIFLQRCEAQPDTVQWLNCGTQTAAEQVAKVFFGFGIIALACLSWGVVFFAPYAWYVLTFNYENGRSPGFWVSFAFSMIVVIGNAIMYEVCARISDWVGFRFKDQREACYMVLYTVACLFNVVLDFVTTYRTAEKVVEGLGFRTYFGIPLGQIQVFTAKFESYGMQRVLAENTFGYAWPSTFLIPFLIEPFVTIIVPLFVGTSVVRTHPEVKGRDAEEWVAAIPMEMGRYADLLLNSILGILIFYFPGGYTWKLFLGMAFSHAYIFVFDHWKVLRAIPACVFAGYEVEFCAQALMAPIVAIMAACIVYRTNCQPGYHCINPWTQGHWMIFLTTTVFIVHTALHLLCLIYVVPLFGRKHPETEPGSYKDLAAKHPCSWFSSNPVFCLRSKYMYGHKPPCSFYVLGKERFMQANKSIGCFYDGEAQDRPKSA